MSNILTLLHCIVLTRMLRLFLLQLQKKSLNIEMKILVGKPGVVGANALNPVEGGLRFE